MANNIWQSLFVGMLVSSLGKDVKLMEQLALKM
jgi:hypothetical protein